MSGWDDFTFESADILLKRNWFMDNESLGEFLDNLSQEVYDEVLERKHEYCQDVRWAIPSQLIPPRYTPRVRVRELTDTEWQTMKQQEDADIEKRISEERSAFEAPPREHEIIDELLEIMIDTLEERKKEYADLEKSTKNTRKYVPPSMRGKLNSEDPVLQKAADAVKIVENELAEVRKRLEAANKRWKESAWCDAVLKGAARKHLSRTDARAHTPSA